MSVPQKKVIVIGSGIGGLSSALLLAHAGCEVTVLERAAVPGGKLAGAEVGGSLMDVGPTVFTMRWVFEEIFAAIGESLDDAITLDPLDILARHAWCDGARMDLHADIHQSADVIRTFAGAAEGQRFLAFCAHAKRIYETLEPSFIRAPAPSLMRIVGDLLPHRPGDLWAITPFKSLWNMLGTYFHDPRLHQLFGRYATYCGGSPWRSPATLMLVAHVERSGVWSVRGGMRQIAHAMTAQLEARGSTIRCNAHAQEIIVNRGRASGVVLASGEVLKADAVVANSDVSAIASGLFGSAVAKAAGMSKVTAKKRSLSAITFALNAPTSCFPLHRHNVFFSPDYAQEFAQLAALRRIPDVPTVYVCAQDRTDNEIAAGTPERLFCIVNAAANGDEHTLNADEIKRHTEATFNVLQRCGLTIDQSLNPTLTSTQNQFAERFPGTGGALYGRAPHGVISSFQRPGVRSKLPGLFLAGGSAHPGPGVAMSALSGRMAATEILKDFK